MAMLLIDEGKVASNMVRTVRRCAAHGLDVIGVVKACRGHEPIVRSFARAGCVGLAFSRLDSPVAANSEPGLPRTLIALTTPDQAERTVRLAEVSHQTELSTILALADAAARQRRRHEVVLMVDVGDHREGLAPEQVSATARAVCELNSPYLKLGGIAANYACSSGRMPDAASLALIAELAATLEQTLCVPMNTVSVGGSVMLDWLDHGPVPPGIRQVRIGEAALLGTLPAVGRLAPDLHRDAFRLRGRIVELKRRQIGSDAGPTGADALGRRPRTGPVGRRLRALLDFGAVDTDPAALEPVDDGVVLVSTSSDCTVFDVTDCSRALEVGDSLEFLVHYSALIRAFHSQCTRRISVNTHFPSITGPMTDITTTSSSETNPHEQLESLIDRLLRGRARITTRDDIDAIHRQLVLNHPILTNPMYVELISGRMTRADMAVFLNCFHYGSSLPFCTEALFAGRDAHDHPAWNAYVNMMLGAELEPRPHHVMFEELVVDSVGLFDDVFGLRFGEAMRRGFSRSLAFSMGYSLGVEVEAEYALTIMRIGVERLFPEQVARSLWFETHLSETGEEEHARISAATAEQLAQTDEDVAELRAGFIQALDDTLDFMLDILRHIQERRRGDGQGVEWRN